MRNLVPSEVSTRSVRPAVLLAITLGAASLAAHGDDQVLIQALSDEIARTADADLLIRRGELYRHHQDWTRAEADFAAAARLEPDLAVIDYFRARTLLESGDAESARRLANRYVSKAPTEAEGWFLRGDILAALGQPAAGAADYDEGIRRAARPRPEHFLQRAKLLAATPSAQPDQVLAVIDAGIARLGPVIALVDYAIGLELAREDYAAALRRIAIAIEHSPRRETWLVRRGDVLLQAGRAAEAAAAYRAALAAIADLPVRVRDTVPTEKLARDARSALERLAAAGEVAPPAR